MCDAAEQQSNDIENHSLKLAVKTSLANFLSERLSSGGDIAQDVYRAMRDEANLLLERQLVADALDSDPFELMKISSSAAEEEEEEKKIDDSALRDKKKNRAMIERFKKMMSVISCDRTTTLDGYSSIRAILQLQNDGMMGGVKDNIRLHFSFVREPQQDTTTINDDSEAIVLSDTTNENRHNVDVDESNYFDSNNDGKRKRSQSDEKNNKRACHQDQVDTDGQADDDNDSFTPKTIVTYKIDMSIDYGQMETLLGVDIYALGNRPSVEEAIPMIHEDDKDEDMGDDSSSPDSDAIEIHAQNAEANFEEIEMTDTDDTSEENAGKGDRFGVFIDPQLTVNFLNHVNMNLNDQSVIYFLLTLPFYEHEWDISGFVLSTMFDNDDSDDDDDDGDGDNYLQENSMMCLPCA